MTLLTLDDVVNEVIGPQFITRRTLMENLRPGRKYAGCARKSGNRWAFTDDDITKLLDRMRVDDDDTQDLDPQPESTRLPSGMSPRSPRVRRSA